jgi:IS5 family transposase
VSKQLARRLCLKDLQVRPLHCRQTRFRIRHERDGGKPFQAAPVRETIGQQLLERHRRLRASGLAGQQVLEGDVVDIRHVCKIDLKWRALMTHFRGEPAKTGSRHWIDQNAP